MDTFPEAFERFERVVSVDEIESFGQLRLAFEWFAGEKWKGSPLQISALAVEARKRGIPVTLEQEIQVAPSRMAKSWRHEVITVKGHSQDRYRDLKTGRFIKKP